MKYIMGLVLVAPVLWMTAIHWRSRETRAIPQTVIAPATAKGGSGINHDFSLCRSGDGPDSMGIYPNGWPYINVNIYVQPLYPFIGDVRRYGPVDSEKFRRFYVGFYKLREKYFAEHSRGDIYSLNLVFSQSLVLLDEWLAEKMTTGDCDNCKFSLENGIYQIPLVIALRRFHYTRDIPSFKRQVHRYLDRVAGAEGAIKFVDGRQAPPAAIGPEGHLALLTYWTIVGNDKAALREWKLQILAYLDQLGDRAAPVSDSPDTTRTVLASRSSSLIDVIRAAPISVDHGTSCSLLYSSVLEFMAIRASFGGSGSANHQAIVNEIRLFRSAADARLFSKRDLRLLLTLENWHKASVDRVNMGNTGRNAMIR